MQKVQKLEDNNEEIAIEVTIQEDSDTNTATQHSTSAALQQHSLTVSDYLRNFFLSSSYYRFTLGMFILSLALLLYVLWNGGRAASWWFLILELCVNMAMVIEIALKVYLETPQQFFTKWVNWIDLCIIALCVLSFSSFLLGVLFSERGSEFLGVEEQIEEIIESILLTFRYATQALRLCVMLRNHVNKRRMKQRDGVSNYDSLENEEGIEMVNAKLPAIMKMGNTNDDLISNEEQEEADSAGFGVMTNVKNRSSTLNDNAAITAMRE